MTPFPTVQATEEKLLYYVPKAWILPAALGGSEGQQLPSWCSISVWSLPGLFREGLYLRDP